VVSGTLVREEGRVDLVLLFLALSCCARASSLSSSSYARTKEERVCVLRNQQLL